MMRDFRRIEDEGGFHWDLKLNGKVHKVVFKLAIQFIIGDCEGHDEICGRKKGHSLDMKGLCRDCDCLPNQSDNPDHECNFFKSDTMESLDKDELANIGFHHIDNAFYDIELGSNPGGIFNATPPEHLHQMAGLVDYLYVHFESVLGNPTKDRIDVTIMQIVKNYGRQSERRFHSLSPFRTGIFKCSSLTSKEKVGRIYALYLCMLNPSIFQHIATYARRKRNPETGKNEVLDGIGYQSAKKWLKLFEAMIVYDAWVRMPEHDPEDIRGPIANYEDLKDWKFESACMKSSRKLMHLYKTMVQRTEGTGLKLTKFHQILHHCRTISDHGSMLNVDSGRPESTHKVLSKDQARKTQKRKATLIEQTAKRLSEDTAVKDAKSAFMTLKADDTLCNSTLKENAGSKFTLKLKRLGPDVHNAFEAKLKWNGKLPSSPLSSTICQAITKRLFFHVGVGGCLKHDSVIKGFTEYKPSKNVLFRAHPSYLIGEPWFDWAMINWNGDDDEVLVPAKLILFIDLVEAKVMSREEHNTFCTKVQESAGGRRPIINDGEDYPYLDNGKWALIQSAIEAEDVTQVSINKPMMKMCKRFHLEPKLRLIPLETIADVAFCVMDDPNNKLDDNMTGYRLVDRENWGTSFKSYFD